MSSHNQKEVNYRQIGDIPNSDTESFIIIPNRISRSDISHIQKEHYQIRKQNRFI